ncbi:shikimate kinase [Bacillus wudalianchiensis]|uniref:Shikimate kinase n=2 Tax=Pseudobacillus wudalianchiensis TaxID=1743143 RepID=A0A1B9AZ53_9BACI|nr:shikimate kinase [Bacillus wudalianchiensis]
MGVGKTTIGSLVAQKLDRAFIDIDEEIEKQYNMSINEIFAAHGEKAFREIEKQTIRSFCEQPLKVISLGGGAFMQPEVREICLANCFVIYLEMSWEEWKERLDLLIDTRPVLRGKDLKEIEELFYKRQEAYAINHSTLTVGSKSAEEAADDIIESVKLSEDLR